MPETLTIPLKNFIRPLSQALDLLNLRIAKHHCRVTLAALKLGKELNLSPKDELTLFYAGLLHDLGAIPTREKLEIMNFDCPGTQPHPEMGQRLLAEIQPFQEVAEVIRYHHDHWLGPNQSGLLKDKIPLLSQILHLSDRLEVLISDEKYILEQRKQITNKIVKFAGQWFNPVLVDTFKKIARREVFWLDLSTEFMSDILDELAPDDERTLSLDDILKISRMFSRVVDYKSRYTKIHSERVAEISTGLAQQLKLPESKIKLLKVAGLIHDIGKLSIPDSILDKPAVLNPDEYAIVRKHPYYTYHILKPIKDFEEISQWAAFHHERLDGKGYPFGLSSEQIPLEAKIIAVADVFTALNEDRAYRRKLPKEQVLNILNQSLTQGTLDPNVVDTLKLIKTD